MLGIVFSVLLAQNHYSRNVCWQWCPIVNRKCLSGSGCAGSSLCGWFRRNIYRCQCSSSCLRDAIGWGGISAAVEVLEVGSILVWSAPFGWCLNGIPVKRRKKRAIIFLVHVQIVGFFVDGNRNWISTAEQMLITSLFGFSIIARSLRTRVAAVWSGLYACRHSQPSKMWTTSKRLFWPLLNKTQ